MRRLLYKRGFWLLLLIVLFTIFLSNEVKADNKMKENENKFYLGTLVNTGKDTGYSGNNSISEKDPHFGWKLGHFYISGYSRVVDKKENPIFLKTAGDRVALHFYLEQDIKCLNKDENLSISDDKNGYDKYFEVGKTNFGQGTLIIRKKDYQNNTDKPTIYTDFLVANMGKNNDVKIELFEEGDYEVALNYEIKNDPRNILGLSIVPTYTNYRIFFSFLVRNGNCMVFPFDVETKEELTNSSLTENGFYLDLAKSRYLDIDVKKEVLKDSKDGLVEDIRFNRPAKDGEKYIEEGIYTITVSNRYTKEKTVKKIYVGNNKIMKAHVVTGLSIKEIKNSIENGAKINKNGKIKMQEMSKNKFRNKTFIIVIGIIGSVFLVIVLLLLLKKSRIKNKTEENKE